MSSIQSESNTIQQLFDLTGTVSLATGACGHLGKPLHRAWPKLVRVWWSAVVKKIKLSNLLSNYQNQHSKLIWEFSWINWMRLPVKPGFKEFKQNMEGLIRWSTTVTSRFLLT